MPESSQKNNRSLLLKYAVNILNRRPYFSVQLKAKLQLKAQSQKLESYEFDIDSILQDLQKGGYLNDSYLAESFVRRCLKRIQGPKIITYKLRQLGLSTDQIQAALNSEESKQALSDAKSKIAALFSDPNDFKLKSKLYQRGF